MQGKKVGNWIRMASGVLASAASQATGPATTRPVIRPLRAGGNHLMQGGVVAALRNQLSNAAPGVGGTVAAPLSGAALSALPPRSEAPQIVAKILEEARASGVELPRGQYEYIPARDGVASLYRMTFPVHATYPQLRTFMDRTLLALPAVAVDGMRIERKAVGEDAVDAELKFSAFVRSDP